MSYLCFLAKSFAIEILTAKETMAIETISLLSVMSSLSRGSSGRGNLLNTKTHKILIQSCNCASIKRNANIFNTRKANFQQYLHRIEYSD